MFCNVIIAYGIKYFYIIMHEYISQWINSEKYFPRAETPDQNETKDNYYFKV